MRSPPVRSRCFSMETRRACRSFERRSVGRAARIDVDRPEMEPAGERSDVVESLAAKEGGQAQAPSALVAVDHDRPILEFAQPLEMIRRVLEGNVHRARDARELALLRRAAV